MAIFKCEILIYQLFKIYHNTLFLQTNLHPQNNDLHNSLAATLYFFCHQSVHNNVSCVAKFLCIS